MASRQRLYADYDSPWKEALDRFLPAFLLLFFPDIYQDIDWRCRWVALDKEFQQIIRKAKPGKLLADKLYKVWRKNGEERWLFIHVEIQGQVEEGFPRRMFDYNVRVFQLYNRTVVSLALLCDETPAWRPHEFGYGEWNCDVRIVFRTAKLLDWKERTAELETSLNPLAPVVLAHLKALETRRSPASRWAWKLRIVKGLYQRGWSEPDVRELFRMIDWIMALPEAMQEDFREEVHHYEEEKRMRYVTSIERLAQAEGRKEGRQLGRKEGRQLGRKEGRQLGRKEGMLEGIELDLEMKFGKEGLALLPRIKALTDLAELRALARDLKTAKKLDSLRAKLGEIAK